MKLVRCGSLMKWPMLREYRQLSPHEYVDWGPEREASPPGSLFYVSHRWITSEHPDPEGVQLEELKRRLEALTGHVGSLEDALVFYDYCSIPQRPRTDAEEVVFHRDLEALRHISGKSEKVIVLSEGYEDYRNRTWCFFELLIAEGNLHLFEDQGAIKEDIRFRASLLPRPEDIGVHGAWITSGSFNYEIRYPEVDSLVASFQHLESCRASHEDDVPLVRLEVARYFDSRQMTPFARFVTGAAKFFELAIVLVPVEDTSVGPTECRPYFDEPTWKRLPLGGGAGPGPLAVPEAAFGAISRGSAPLLRLKRAELVDAETSETFLRPYYDAPDWEAFVVQPATTTRWGVGHEANVFATLGHVVHTALEKLGGLGAGPGCLYLQLFDTPAATGR